MTREEQIRQEINFQLAGSFGNYLEGYEEGFIEGAKWADEHPNLYNNEKYHTVKVSCLDELNRKAVLYDEFLEKACKWLENNMYYHNCGNYDVLAACCSDTIEEVIEKFKKAMEE